ncbi:hypothetical protein Glove_151g72 [Diversispora epigaea]|uniref:Protein kinase domain-containing protein n=1 Tax=Diversispora epigaea TaxID=1348612 RepID=A0A397IXP1_9GLOM|nr:hypothetical protein Glove_151g72 [Diversispora epigaea]
MDSIGLDFYQKGIGTIKDEEKTFQWYCHQCVKYFEQFHKSVSKFVSRKLNNDTLYLPYLKSAERGYSKGQVNLANCYYYGIGTTKDEERAFQINLEIVIILELEPQKTKRKHFNRIGTTKNVKKGIQLLSKSAERGNFDVQHTIESLYRNEFEISTIKKYQNKSKHIKDVSLTLSKSPTSNLNSIENLIVKNHNCCICWQTNNVAKDHNDIINIIIQTNELDETANDWEIWKWIDYSKFKDIKYLDEGAFGTVWKAEWIDMPEELLDVYNCNLVALK